MRGEGEVGFTNALTSRHEFSLAPDVSIVLPILVGVGKERTYIHLFIYLLAMMNSRGRSIDPCISHVLYTLNNIQANNATILADHN